MSQKKKTELDKAFQDFTIKEPTRGGWKVTPLSAEKAANHMVYAQRMAKELKEARGDFKLPVSKVQAASTQRVLDMTDEELEAYRNRKIDIEKAQVWKNQDEANAALTAAEARKKSLDGLILEDARRKPKNDQGSAWSEGESPLKKYLTPERAIDAFMETKAVLSPMEQAMIATADPKVFKGVVEDKKKRPLWRRILSAKWVHDDESQDPNIFRMRK